MTEIIFPCKYCNLRLAGWLASAQWVYATLTSCKCHKCGTVQYVRNRDIQYK